MGIGLNRRGIVLAALLLGGCASTHNIYGGLVGQNVAGNAVSVSVSNVWNQADALPIADQHCQQYGKAARFSAMEGNVASFDCLTP